MGKLVLFLADGTTLDIPLERDRVTIGRHRTNDVCLPYPPVSGAHAVVVPVTAGAVIEDLGSTNGTFINGKRAPRQFLHDGDRIEIGRQRFVYLADINAVVSRAPAPVQAAAAVSDLATPGTGERMEQVPESSSDIAVSSNGSAASDDIRAGLELELDAQFEARPGPAEATLRVLSGPNAGRSLSLDSGEMLVGRVGLQVAALRRIDQAYRLVPTEGEAPPKLNGVAVPDEGALLQAGDIIELAGASLEFGSGQPARAESSSLGLASA